MSHADYDLAHTITTTAGPERILEALTTPAGLSGWWAKDADFAGDGEAEHTLRFQKGDTLASMVFRVDEAGPERVRWTCTANGNPVWVGTTLTWTLRDGAIDFVHAGFAEGASPPYRMTAEGWGHFHASLSSWLDTGAGQPW